MLPPFYKRKMKTFPPSLSSFFFSLSIPPPHFFPQDLTMLFKLPANLRPGSLNSAQCAGITDLGHSTLLKAKATHNQFLPLNLPLSETMNESWVAVPY